MSEPPVAPDDTPLEPMIDIRPKQLTDISTFQVVAPDDTPPQDRWFAQRDAISKPGFITVLGPFTRAVAEMQVNDWLAVDEKCGAYAWQHPQDIQPAPVAPDDTPRGPICEECGQPTRNGTDYCSLHKPYQVAPVAPDDTPPLTLREQVEQLVARERERLAEAYLLPYNMRLADVQSAKLEAYAEVLKLLPPIAPLGCCLCGHGEGFHRFTLVRQEAKSRPNCNLCDCESYRPRAVAPDDTPTRLAMADSHWAALVRTGKERTDALAEVSRLQQENALLRRSLEVLCREPKD